MKISKIFRCRIILQGRGELLDSFWYMMGCFSSSEDDEAKKRSKKIDIEIRQDKIAYRATHRLLLLGICLCYFYWICLCYW